MKLRRRLAFSLIPLLLLVAGGEVALWVADWPKARTDLTFEHNQSYWVADPGLDHHPYPHRETGGAFTVSTDQQGLRYPLHPLEPSAGADPFRVMFLGCSTTFGWGVDDEQTYPARVQASLDAQGRRGIEVFNAGQPGHTSFQGLWFYQNALRAYHPDLVFFGYVVQDARLAAYSDASQALLQQDARFLKQTLLYHSHLYLGLRTLIDAWRIRSKERDESGHEGVYRVSREDYVENIRAFARLTARDDARLVLFDFPLERAGYTREHRRLVRIAAEELDLPHLDIQAEVEEASRSQELYFPKDPGHANAEGHAFIADRVLGFLQAESLLPR
ncbi:MAG: SGNH/GDSL hydrolase family protein [Pseudomonadota bacterium]